MRNGRIGRSLGGALAACALAACGSGGLATGGDGGTDGGGDGGPTTTVSREQAEKDFLAAYCKQLATCAPLLVKIAFGDEATCNSRYDLVLSSTEPMGSNDTPGRIESCAQAIAALSCHDVFAGPLPPVCSAPAGTLANGAACGDDSQCVSSHCLHPAGAGCGTCGPTPTVGTDCSNGIDCGTGLTCLGGVCAKWVEKGGACDSTHPCNPVTSGCKGMSTSSMGTCVDKLAAGAACDPQGQTTGPCDFLAGDVCNPATKVCQAISYASAGQACGFLNGTYVACEAGAKCKLAGASGTCEAPAADGAACDSMNGPNCLTPAQCKSGICTLPAPGSCQ